MPDAPDRGTFWKNIREGRYSISDVPKERWREALYYDPDRRVPAKSYTKIGGWIRDFEWDPLKWKLPIPPKVSDAMDLTQKWAILGTRQALEDFGYPNRPLPSERTAVILGNAMGGDMHLYSASRIFFPEFAEELKETSAFTELPGNVQRRISEELYERVSRKFPTITEDTMPGELSNIIAGRIAALYDFHGPNYVADAACASAMAAITAAAEGLAEEDFDAVITGGIDANMSASTFVKFCKIGALSATGTRPYAKGADGFVMGEGAAIFLLKRLADAERDGDRIYAVIRGLGGSSDGKGRGITAPNPVGQRLAVERAWQNAGLSPLSVTMVEGHGTSTAVGDVVEVECLNAAFGTNGQAKNSIALGSVKSNIGHLKGAAGAAGILKATLALHEKVLPPSLNFDEPNPQIDFANSLFYVNTELRPWQLNGGPDVRRAGVSAFGFGGTNFHVVLEEYVPGRITSEAKTSVSMAGLQTSASTKVSVQKPLRGVLLVGGDSESVIAGRLKLVLEKAREGDAPAIETPLQSDLQAAVRLAIDYGGADELADKAAKALTALESGRSGLWRMLRAKGIFLGRGPAPKTAFLFTGQGSQYVNMLQDLRASEPIVAETFAEADKALAPLLDKPLTEYIFVNGDDKVSVGTAEEALRQTAITQPAVLATDIALTRLLAAYSVVPDVVIGHSLGEYGALVASGTLSFAEALKAVSARGTEMTKVSMADNGKMAAVFGPIDEVEKIIADIKGYVVIANINSSGQSVIGGASDAVELAVKALQKAGFTARPLQVSHAFHTKIVAPASAPMRQVLEKFGIQAPRIPIISNVTGDFYPCGPGQDVVPQIVDLLSRQIAAPVQFVKGLNNLYDAGARVFVEVGPKRALHGFVEDVLGDKEDMLALSTNHPRLGDFVSFNQALCGFYASGIGTRRPSSEFVEIRTAEPTRQSVQPQQNVTKTPVTPSNGGSMVRQNDHYLELGHLFAEFLDKGFKIYSGDKNGDHVPQRLATYTCITGAALGLPGTKRVFDDENVARILRGEQFIDLIPKHLRQAMVDKHITRVVKSRDGSGSFETIDSTDDVIKLAGRSGDFDLSTEFGYPKDRLAALDIVTSLAIGAGIDALRDAGIPLVLRYKTTTTGSKLPDQWMLPDDLRDDTGIIFGSAFPGFDSYANEMKRHYQDQARRERLRDLEDLRAKMTGMAAHSVVFEDIDFRIQELHAEIAKNPYTFDRRFLFKVLSMGHSQFAEYIGARGPNTQLNAACATTTQAIAVADDWIKAGRCRRVIIITSDNVTTDNMMDWFGAGFLATGAAATDEIIEDAAIPFDRRRHGMIVGMGGAAIVVESVEAARERGVQPICDVLGAVTANSAFHGTRLDVDHICQVMEKLIAQAEAQWGIDRYQIAPATVFVSHETYTPARGGSASAEVNALRTVFGSAADQIVIANTKGFTGHAMATGIEDVVAIKALETGIVPPVANFKEVDPELGQLNLSRGGAYPVQYALRLGAGFGSQISMSLIRWVPTLDGRRRAPSELGFAYRISDKNAWNKWLCDIARYPSTELEIDRRTLKIKDQGPASSLPADRPAIAEPKRPPVTAAVSPAAQPSMMSPEAVVPPTVLAADDGQDPVAEKVMRIIAEKTGYPTDMLDRDLDLEADLGIDTVKQAEMFAAIREAYDIPRDETLQLRNFPTLAHAIRFVYDRRPDLEAVIQTKPEGGKSAPATTVSATAEAVGQDRVREKVLQIIANQTGYPPDMLDLDLDLEADLGIDTVKQAEMFAAIRAAYDIPRDDTLQLRDFPTLAHTIQFVYDKRPDLKTEAPQPEFMPKAAPVAEPASTSAAPGPAAADDEVRNTILRIIADKTGYPPDMLDLDLDLEADLGIDTVKQAEMFAAIREAYDIPRDDTLQLRDFPTLAHTLQFVYDRRPDLAAKTLPAGDTNGRSAAAQTIAQPAGTEGVRATVLQIIADKTGYPPEMLDLDLDLEADLGIDTVKQAEMFAAIRERYDIPRDDTLQLRDYPTLAHAIQFVFERRPGIQTKESAELPGTVSAGEPGEEVGVGTAEITASMEEANRIPRRIPVPHLRPSLDLCKDTGVNLDSNSRVVVMCDEGNVGKSLVSKLRKRGVQVLVLDHTPKADELLTCLGTWMAEGPVQGIYWLPALDDEGLLSEMDLSGWHTATHRRVKLLYHTMRTLYQQIDKKGTFLIAATRLGGQHGYDETGAVQPLGGAVAGFTKAYKREKPDVTVKVVDFEKTRKTAAYADLLIEEALRDPGAVEIGYRNGQRWTIVPEERPIPNENDITLDKDTIFVITGAAGSIVSAIIADLAAASGGTFHLLDLTPEPDPGSEDLKRFVSDKDGLKRDIFQRLKDSGERATPAMVEKELAKLERSYAALSAINAVKRAGGTPVYHSVNLLDGKAMAGVMKTIEKKSGRIDVLLHAGGLEISHLLPDKEPAEFDLVFDVKSDGWFNLMSNLGNMPLGAVVVFSSIAGRFGNMGQTDYSAANDLLCKSVLQFKSTRPETRGIAIDWTAWGKIGMAARGSIPTVMKAAGIDMLPPEGGIPIVRRELCSGAKHEEVVIAQSLGMMLQEFDESGGLETNNGQLANLLQNNGIMLGRVTGMGIYRGLTIETPFDPKQQPFLYDHQINGTPVLPGVMGLEALAETAKLLFPNLRLSAITDVQFAAPFKFYRHETRDISLQASFRQDGSNVIADCRLIGSRKLHGQEEAQITTHFTAKVCLSPDSPKSQKAKVPAQGKQKKVVAGDIYKLYFHGPAYQVLESCWQGRENMIGVFAQKLPANHEPDSRPTVTTPRLIELCFQTAGIWEMGRKSRMGLPYQIDEVQILKTPAEGAGKFFAIVTPAKEGSFDAQVLDAKGEVYVTLAGYRTMELPETIDTELLKPLTAILG
jgi:malonyl CoA-acyl carrier protein transacylase